MSFLVLVRHGQSEWNLKKIFTGWHDIGLTEAGRQEAQAGGQKLRELNIKFDEAFTSVLKRAYNTLEIILKELSIPDLPTTKNQALNERDYGNLTGRSKVKANEIFGEEQVHLWRRSYDVPPPAGESLKNTGERTIPYFEEKFL